MAAKRPEFSTPKPVVPCAHFDCTRRAIISEKTQTGWAHFCEQHYVEFHHASSKKWCEENGLHTVEEMKEFCRQKLGTIFKPLPQREPGCDDEPERKYMPNVEAKPVAGIER